MNYSQRMKWHTTLFCLFVSPQETKPQIQRCQTTQTIIISANLQTCQWKTPIAQCWTISLKLIAL